MNQLTKKEVLDGAVSDHHLMDQAPMTVEHYMIFFFEKWPDGTMAQALKFAHICALDFETAMKAKYNLFEKGN